MQIQHEKWVGYVRKNQPTELNVMQFLIMSSPSSLDILIQLDLHIRKVEAIFYVIG